MKNPLKNVLIILLNTVLLLVVIEVIVRIFWNQSDKAIIVEGPANAIQFDSGHYTFSHVPGVKYFHKNPEFKIYYAINNEGMREDETFLDKKRDTTVIRVLVIGDSFTYGEGSELKDVWHTRIERSLNRKGKHVEMINAGVGAYDQYQEYYCLKRIIALYKPDYVLLGFVPNDLLSNKDINNKSWPTNLQAADAPEGLYVKLMHNYHTLALVTRSVLVNKTALQRKAADLPFFDYFKVTDKRSPDISWQYEITSMLLHQMDSLCKTENAGFIVACIPHVYESIAKEIEGINLFAVEDFIAMESKKSGFAYLPSLDYFRKKSAEGIKTHYYVDGHLTPEGNKVLADAIEDDLGKILEK